MNDTIVVFDRIRENAGTPARQASSTGWSTSRSTRPCRAPSSPRDGVLRDAGDEHLRHRRHPRLRLRHERRRHRRHLLVDLRRRPILIWLNDKYVASQKKPEPSQPRRAAERDRPSPIAPASSGDSDRGRRALTARGAWPLCLRLARSRGR